MNIEEFQAELELEREWREDDIRFFHNLQARLENAGDRQRLRRSIIGMFYAHIEGFVYFSFDLYANSINRLELKCSDVKPAIAAASLSAEFLALKNSDKKNPIFKRELPEDRKLHQICREIDFLDQIREVNAKKVKIPKNYINTENNVGPTVLRKLLYQMGLDHKDLDEVSTDLLRLLNIRNDIAHGKRKDGIEDDDYIKFKDCFNTIFSRISNLLVKAFSDKDYLIIEEPHPLTA